MRKSLSLFMAVLLAAALFLTACQSPNGNQAGNAAEGNQSAAEGANGSQGGSAEGAGAFPLAEQKETLRVLAIHSDFVEDYETNAFTQWYEELTNVKVEWEFATSQEGQEKLNLALSSGDLPDVIMGFNVSPAQQMVYGQQGIFLALNELIEQYGVETKQLFEAYPEVKKASTAPDGNIYSLSTIDRNPHTFTGQKMWIYTPWLEKLNLSMPTTTEEFENVLKAFKTMDPNGNGKADEIPMAGGIQNVNTAIDSFLMNAFLLHDKNTDLMMMSEDGKVDVNFNKPAYKEGLAYLNKLYAQGLIAPESFTQNNNQLKAMVENGEPKVGVISSTVPQTFSDIAGERWKAYKTVPALAGPSGLRQTPYNYYNFAGGNFLITAEAANPELAFRWADALYNADINMRANIGEEGVGWKKPENGELGLNGEPANWIRLISYGTLQNNHWMQTSAFHFPREMFEGLAAGPTEIPRVLYEETMKNYEPYKMKQELKVPPIFFNEQQSAELSDLKKTIMDYVSEMRTRFIIGDTSIEKDWDKYVSTLENMNLKRYLDINNEAYNAQYHQ
ncbi:extracellular solute-binding protein [Paenibacillus arenilitoris]|uniref:Extracellular solute-binding protein n=1 Tax=Paenibacillus arenilitoris TaxID=2772299 RepID=A0A927CKT2_9BACL|nr:extracellular solute-binding protein [Paenibacillus arenilitoris]MBD2869007.1 extracellular solute-binding protein [Paenibacillus arenilitoris]